VDGNPRKKKVEKEEKAEVKGKKTSPVPYSNFGDRSAV